MKQTAVEFQTEQIGILVSKLFNDEISKTEFHFKRFEICEQAKEMEKQQIENAFDDGWNRANETKHQAYTTLEDMGSNYYNKTFNNK